MERRVVDLVTGHRGTAWAQHGTHHLYRVRWDEPTPNQDTAWAVIPSAWFDWLDDEAES